MPSVVFEVMQENWFFVHIGTINIKLLSFLLFYIPFIVTTDCFDVGLKCATCEYTVACLSNLTILSLMIADI